MLEWVYVVISECESDKYCFIILGLWALLLQLGFSGDAPFIIGFSIWLLSPIIILKMNGAFRHGEQAAHEA